MARRPVVPASTGTVVVATFPAQVVLAVVRFTELPGWPGALVLVLCTQSSASA